MKPGSLIVPVLNYEEKLSKGFRFDPIIPNPQEVYTCHSVHPSGKNKDKIYLKVVESKIFYNDDEIMFDATEWREVQDPIEGSHLLSEINSLIIREKVLI